MRNRRDKEERMDKMDNEVYIVPNPTTPNAAIVIDPELCIGCKRCVRVCRTDVLIPVENKKPPCVSACPAGIDIKKQLDYIAKGQYAEALILIKEATPLPLACSRVCPRFCEKKCGRTGLEGPVAINMTKRFVADLDARRGGPYTPQAKEATGHKVAVVGSGPAGLSAAYYSALEGHSVSLFEASPKLGGLLRYGVPDFRLPKAVLDKEVDSVAGLCKEVRTNVTLGRDFTIDSLKDQGFEAVVLAVGAEGVLRLNVPGEELAGVYHGVTFLRDLNSGKEVKIGSKVVVIGGGMVAVDSAQCAVRMGAADVTLVALEGRDAMPAYSDDVALAEEEGIKILSCWGVKRIAGNGGKVGSIELKACTSVADEHGRFLPCYNDGQTCTLDADTVIVAVGQTTDLSFLDGKIKVGRVIETDDECATSLTGVYAAGDVVTGSKTVIDACAAGHRAAEAVNRYLRGQGIASAEMVRTVSGYDVDQLDRQEYADIDRKRVVIPSLAAEERKHTFAEIELGVSEDEVRKEAGRCFACGEQPIAVYPDECWFCGCCVTHCPVPGAIRMDFPMNQRVGWKRKETGEFYRIGMKNPLPPNKRPPIE
jgi:formate dehydrogenase major subunit